jgi:hypothetical protein
MIGLPMAWVNQMRGSILSKSTRCVPHMLRLDFDIDRLTFSPSFFRQEKDFRLFLGPDLSAIAQTSGRFHIK